MGEYEKWDLEQRIGSAYNRAEGACRNGIGKFLEGVKKGSTQIVSPYISIVRNPEKPFYALGDIIKNVVQIPADFYHYFRDGSVLPASFERRISRSLAIGEVIAFYGAKYGAHAISNISDNRFLQATAGGLIGSEVTTAAVFFITYFTYSSVFNLKSIGWKGIARKLIPTLKETCKVTSVIIPVGLASFASADIGIASLAVLCGLSSGIAATIGCVAGSVLYSGTAKVAVNNSAENGHIKHS